MNSGMYDLEKMAEFDLKKVWPYNNRKKLNGTKLIELLKSDLCGDSVELYINYKKTVDKHLDDTDGKFLPMRVLYNILWGRKEIKENDNNYDEDIENTCQDKKKLKEIKKHINVNGYSKFRKSYIDEIGQDALWGGDCINSVQTQLKVVAPKIGAAKSMYTKMNGSVQKIIDAGFSDICKLSGCIGNYVLVPAYFNVNRIKTIGKKDDNWQDALYELKTIENLSDENGWNNIIERMKEHANEVAVIKKETTENDAVQRAQDLYKPYEKKYFTQYINTMFLWDYVRADKENGKYDVLDLGHNKTEDKTNKPDKTDWLQNIHYAIKNRGIFMSAMLMIALVNKIEENGQLKKNRNLNCEVVKDWNEWKVSDIYKKIMKEVICRKELYNGYPEVFHKIDTVINGYYADKECGKYKEIKSILENAQKLIVNVDKKDCELQCPTKQETVNLKNTNKK